MDIKDIKPDQWVHANLGNKDGDFDRCLPFLVYSVDENVVVGHTLYSHLRGETVSENITIRNRGQFRPLLGTGVAPFQLSARQKFVLRGVSEVLMCFVCRDLVHLVLDFVFVEATDFRAGDCFDIRDRSGLWMEGCIQEIGVVEEEREVEVSFRNWLSYWNEIYVLDDILLQMAPLHSKSKYPDLDKLGYYNRCNWIL